MLYENCTTSSPTTIIPNCIGGTCSSNQCVCFPGYQHDFFFGRFYNCSVPTWFVSVFYGVTLSTLLFSAIYGFYVFVWVATRGTVMRKVSGSASLSSLLYSLCIVSIISNNASMPVYGFVFLILGGSFTAYMAGLLIVSALHPVAAAKFSSDRVEKYERFFINGFPIVFGTVLMATMTWMYAIGTDDAISRGTGVCSLEIGLFSSLYCPLLFRFTTDLITVIEESIASSKRDLNSANTAKFEKVLVKVRHIRLTSTISSFVLAVSTIFAGICVLVYGTLPFGFLFLFLVLLMASGLFIQSSHFASPSRGTSERFSLGFGRRSSTGGDLRSPAVATDLRSPRL